MRLIVVLCLALCATACVAEQTPDSLFDTARADVVPLDEDGVQIGLVNMTHNVVWDYASGYSRFGADNQVVWGPEESFPSSELAQCQAQESDDIGVSSRIDTSRTICACCYYYKDGSGCGCYECFSF